VEYCFYLNWRGLSSSEWAAWVQAVGSVLAILAAAWFPIWHRRRELSRQLNNYVQMLSVAQAQALADASLLWQHVDNVADFSWSNTRWDPIIKALEGIEYHLLPDFRLFVPVQDALADAVACKKIMADAILRAGQAGPITVPMAHRMDAHAVRMGGSYRQAAALANSYGGRTPLQVARWYWYRAGAFFGQWTGARLGASSPRET